MESFVAKAEKQDLDQVDNDDDEEEDEDDGSLQQRPLSIPISSTP